MRIDPMSVWRRSGKPHISCRFITLGIFEISFIRVSIKDKSIFSAKQNPPGKKKNLDQPSLFTLIIMVDSSKNGMGGKHHIQGRGHAQYHGILLF
jgi:hypothetical protein